VNAEPQMDAVAAGQPPVEDDESRLVRLFMDRRLIGFVVTVATLIISWRSLQCFDVWLHLKSGQWIVQHGRVPYVDPYSFTAGGRAWTYHSWLSSLVLTGVWSLFGVLGLTLLRCVVMAAASLMSWGLAVRRGADPGVAGLIALAAAWQMRMRALMRPFLFSFVLFMAFLLILDAAVRRAPLPGDDELAPRRFAEEDRFLWGSGGRLLLLPMLMLIWVNMHAGFPAGGLLILAYTAGELLRVLVAAGRGGRLTALRSGAQGARLRALIVAGVCCMAAMVVTPYGPDILTYPIRLLREVSLVHKILEWKPIEVSSAYGVFCMLLPIGAVVLICSAALHITFWKKAGRSRVGLLATDVLLFLGFAALGVRTSRHIAWILLLAAPILAANLRPRFSGRSPYTFRLICSVLAVTIGVLYMPIVTFKRAGPIGALRTKLPVEACDFLERTGLGADVRTFCPYEWGGYFIWRFYPDRRVPIDGRCLVYRDDLMGAAFDISNGSGDWEGLLNRWDMQIVMARYRSRDSTHYFRESSRWRCVYWDDTAFIAVRADRMEALAGGMRVLALSNPAVFERSIESAEPQDILDELDAVHAQNPDLALERALRARCLVRLARTDAERRESLLNEAQKLADEAVQRFGSYDTWKAKAEVAAERGHKARAAEATRQSEARRPKWMK
jgi:hypothetical protein